MADQQRSTLVSVSTGSIFKVLLVIFAVWFVYLVRDVVAVLFISFILAAAFDGWVDWLQRRHIPRALGILCIYLLIIGVFSAVISLLVPLLIQEIRGMTVEFPRYWQQITSGVSQLQNFSNEAGILAQFQKILSTVEGTLVRAGQGVFSSILSIFGGIVSFVLVLVLTFYMTVDEGSLKRILRSMLPEHYQPYTTQVVNRMQEKIGTWLQGQMILSVIIAALVYLGLTLIGVKYALVLALLAGIMEFIPYVGPILSAIPAVFFGFTQSPSTALLVVIMYIIVQQLENHFIVPAVMRRALGLHPILSITAILIGAKLFGFLGVLLAIPVLTALTVLLHDVVGEKEEK